MIEVKSFTFGHKYIVKLRSETLYEHENLIRFLEEHGLTVRRMQYTG